jgi:hypothetical protein
VLAAAVGVMQQCIGLAPMPDQRGRGHRQQLGKSAALTLARRAREGRADSTQRDPRAERPAGRRRNFVLAEFFLAE